MQAFARDKIQRHNVLIIIEEVSSSHRVFHAAPSNVTSRIAAVPLSSFHPRGRAV